MSSQIHPRSYQLIWDIRRPLDDYAEGKIQILILIIAYALLDHMSIAAENIKKHRTTYLIVLLKPLLRFPYCVSCDPPLVE